MNDVLRALARRTSTRPRRRAARPRRALTLLLSTTLAAAGVVAPSGSATAAPNPGIVVSDLVITHGEGGPTTVGDVLDLLEKGESAVMSIRNFGEKSLDELRQKMQEKGFLKDEQTPE